MKFLKPAIILVRPQLPENIGMIARAMQNFGLSELILVNPRGSWPNNKSIESAKSAKNIIKNVKIFDSLSKAVEKYNLIFATTNRKRFIEKKKINSFDQFNKLLELSSKSAIIFGPENSGLSNQDLRLADYILTIETSKSNNSLNKSIITSNTDKVSKLELSNFIKILVTDLDSRGFFKPLEKKDTMIDNIYSLYNKIGFSKKELHMVWGMHKKLKNRPKS